MNSSTKIWGTLIAFPAILVQRRNLIARLTIRRIESQYRGSILGRVWPFAQPLLMLAVYTFVFSVVFEMRWGAVAGGRIHFALVLFSGLILFNLVNHGLIGSTAVIREQPSYVKRVVFPLEILPVIVLLEGIVYAAISYAILACAAVLSGEAVTVIGIVAAPMAALPLVIATLGTMWVLAALAVYLRDLAQVTGLVAMVLLFVCPIFYPLEMVPEGFRILLNLNPLTYFVTIFRKLLFEGAFPPAVPWLIALGSSYLFATIGQSFFSRAKRGFADVL